MPCDRCKIPLPANYSPRKCAFESGVFNSKNWNCGTISDLRHWMYEGRDNPRPDCWSTRYGDSSIGVIAVSEDVMEQTMELDCHRGWFIVLSWHKDYGACDLAQLIDDDVQPLELSFAEAVLKDFGPLPEPKPITQLDIEQVAILVTATTELLRDSEPPTLPSRTP